MFLRRLKIYRLVNIVFIDACGKFICLNDSINFVVFNLLIIKDFVFRRSILVDFFWCDPDFYHRGFLVRGIQLTDLTGP